MKKSTASSHYGLFDAGIRRVVSRFRRRWPNKGIDATTVRDHAHANKTHHVLRKLGKV